MTLRSVSYRSLSFRWTSAAETARADKAAISSLAMTRVTYQDSPTRRCSLPGFRRFRVVSAIHDASSFTLMSLPPPLSKEKPRQQPQQRARSRASRNEKQLAVLVASRERILWMSRLLRSKITTAARGGAEFVDLEKS